MTPTVVMKVECNCGCEFKSLSIMIMLLQVFSNGVMVEIWFQWKPTACFQRSHFCSTQHMHIADSYTSSNLKTPFKIAFLWYILCREDPMTYKQPLIPAPVQLRKVPWWNFQYAPDIRLQNSYYRNVLHITAQKEINEMELMNELWIIHYQK